MMDVRKVASLMAAEIEDGIRKGVREGGGGDVVVNQNMVAYLEKRLVEACEAAEHRGRLAGLRMACEDMCAMCKLNWPLFTNGVQMFHIHVEQNKVAYVCEADPIRARIQELKARDG